MISSFARKFEKPSKTPVFRVRRARQGRRGRLELPPQRQAPIWHAARAKWAVITRSCAHCSGDYRSPHFVAKYCTPRCKARARWLREHAQHDQKISTQVLQVPRSVPASLPIAVPDQELRRVRAAARARENARATKFPDTLTEWLASPMLSIRPDGPRIANRSRMMAWMWERQHAYRFGVWQAVYEYAKWIHDKPRRWAPKWVIGHVLDRMLAATHARGTGPYLDPLTRQRIMDGYGL